MEFIIASLLPGNLHIWFHLMVMFFLFIYKILISSRFGLHFSVPKPSQTSWYDPFISFPKLFSLSRILCDLRIHNYIIIHSIFAPSEINHSSGARGGEGVERRDWYSSVRSWYGNNVFHFSVSGLNTMPCALGYQVIPRWITDHQLNIVFLWGWEVAPKK